MADTISQIFEILSKADTSGLDKATQALIKQAKAIIEAAKAADKANSSFARIASGIRRLGSFALNVARGALSRLWGALKGIATLGAGILGGALMAIKDGLGGISDAVSGATNKIKDLAKTGGAAIKAVAAKVKEFVKDAGSFFGAIGKVGAGFVQRARQIVKAPIAIFKGVVKGAKAAGKALGAVALAAAVAGAAIAGAFLGEVAAASPRAAAALDRMGASFGKAKTAFFAAFGETVAPLLEKVATLMEDPRFIAFATMLGTKVGGAVLKVANIIATKTIPNAIALWKATKNLATALRNFLGRALTALGVLARRVWGGLKRGFIRAKNAIVTGVSTLTSTVRSKLRGLATSVKNIFDGIKEDVVDVWSGIQTTISGAIAGAKFAVETAITAIGNTINALTLKLEKPWNAMVIVVEEVWNTVKGVVAKGINFVIDIMNELIKGYNKTLAKLPGASKIPLIPPVSLAEGGIVKSPLLAVVGDAPRSPEVVAPLDKLAAMLRDITGGGLGGIVINVNVVVAPGGFATPEAAGQGVADSMVQALRARGIKLRT